MKKIVRIFIVNRKGGRETFAFSLDAFVSYNVDTRLLTLTNGSVFVEKDSQEAVIKAYRILDDEDQG